MAHENRRTATVAMPDAAARVEHLVSLARDVPSARLELLRDLCAGGRTSPARSERYRRAALAFMAWQVRRGLLNSLDHACPGSPWWRAVNERLLADMCEASLRTQGWWAPSSATFGVDLWMEFATNPSTRTWYRAHNVTIVRAYLDHRRLAEQENRSERFFINLVLMRLLFAHALVAAPRLALSWLAPAAHWIGDPRRAMTQLFLSIARVLPAVYPLHGALEQYVATEHAIG